MKKNHFKKFIHEKISDLGPKQRALFFKCRQLKKQLKVKHTWTADLIIYVRTIDDKKLVITSEADLAEWTTPTQVPTPPPLPPQTPYSTPRPSPARSLWAADSDRSFEGFDMQQPPETPEQTHLEQTLTSMSPQ